MAEISLPLVVGAAVIDSINPCAFGVLIFLLAYLSKTFHDPAKMLRHGTVYIVAVGLTYLAAGLLLLPIIQNLRNFSVFFYYLIAALIILAGLIEIKDLFLKGWGPRLTITPGAAERIKFYTSKISDRLSTAFGLGVFVALVELPCTGAVYLAVLTLMSASGLNFNNLTLLLLYNIIFVLPLIVILYLVVKGGSVQRFKDWQQVHAPLMRLMAGILLVSLGVWMIAFVS